MPWRLLFDNFSDNLDVGLAFCISFKTTSMPQDRSWIRTASRYFPFFPVTPKAMCALAGATIEDRVTPRIMPFAPALATALVTTFDSESNCFFNSITD
jgi:hypothetical protein